MIVKEVIEFLNKMPEDKEIEVFASGEIYKNIEIKYLEEEDVVEIGCGWG